MMGSRGWKGGAECDAFSRKYRRVRIFRPGSVQRLKRKYWKRMRKAAKLAAHAQSETT